MTGFAMVKCSCSTKVHVYRCLVLAQFSASSFEEPLSFREYTDSPLCPLCSLRHVMFIIPT